VSAATVVDRVSNPSEPRRFRPYPLLVSGHLQTIVSALLPGPLPAYVAEPIVIGVADGEALVVHQEPCVGLAHDAPLAILVHGLGGDHSSPYLRRIAGRLACRGLRVWRVDLRGCGHGLDHAYRPAHAGSSHDLAAVIAYAQQTYRPHKIAIAAFSLGGNILLKLLSELAAVPQQYGVDPTGIARAVAIAAPIDLQRCSRNMERPTRMPYTRYYLRLLAEQVRSRAERWEPWRVIQPTHAVRTLRQFDHWYTAPLAGFASADEYYRRASSAPGLVDIQVPTCWLVDQHDPIVPFDKVPPAAMSRHVDLQVTRFGGHLGYLAMGPRGGLHRWLDEWTEHAVCQSLL